MSEHEFAPCRECGHEMFVEAHFCTRCGIRLSALPARVHAKLEPLPDVSELLQDWPSGPNTAKPDSVHAALARAAEAAQDIAQPLLVLAADQIPTAALSERFGAAPSLSIEEVDEGFDFTEQGASDTDDTEGQRGPRASTAQKREECRLADYSREDVLRCIRSKQSLKRAGLNGLDLSGVDFEGVDLTRAELDGAKLDGAKLTGAILHNASLRQASLKGANLDQTRLDKADLTRADLESASLVGANLSRASLDGANLSSATLRGACMTGADLASSRLCGANLTRATLVDADMTQVNASKACFKGASLLRAKLHQAELSETDLSESDARYADFDGAQLSGAILDGIRLANAALTTIKMSAATRASFIDVSEESARVQRLEGAEAIAFLRGRPARSSTATRYFGKGDLLRDAQLEFGPGSKIHIESRFENCCIALGEGAELVIGEAGVLRDCQISGGGEITVHGCFFERQSPGISGARSLVVSSRGAVSGAVQQAAQPMAFAFEPGCRLRIKISRTNQPRAAE